MSKTRRWTFGLVVLFALPITASPHAATLTTVTGRIVCTACIVADTDPASWQDATCLDRCKKAGVPLFLRIGDKGEEMQMHRLTSEKVTTEQWLPAIGKLAQVTGFTSRAGTVRELQVEFFSVVAEHDPALPGNSAHELTLKTLLGEPVALSSLRGQVVVLTFWATWCRPCRAEMPHLVAIQETFGKRGVQVIGATFDGVATKRDIDEFAGSHKLNFPIWLEADSAHMRALGLDYSVPATVIFDRTGRVAYKHQGLIREDSLARQIEPLLKNESSKDQTTLAK